MNVRKAADALAKLAMLKYFPPDPQARTALVGMVCEMATTDDQVEWLVRRMLVLYNEWPGPKELRALFCSRHKPADGIEAKSEKFLEGIPPEKKPEPMKALPPGAVASIDPTLERGVRLLARSKDLNRSIRTQKRRKAADVPNPNFKRITEADVKRAVEENRQRRGEVELAPSGAE